MHVKLRILKQYYNVNSPNSLVLYNANIPNSLHENVINCGIADIFFKVVYNLLFFQLKLF